jgi:hypothetical protein
MMDTRNSLADQSPCNDSSYGEEGGTFTVNLASFRTVGRVVGLGEIREEVGGRINGNRRKGVLGR